MFNHENIDLETIPSLHCDIIEDVTLLPMVGDILGPTYKYALDAYAKTHENDKTMEHIPLPQARRLTLQDPNYLYLPHIKPWKYSDQEVIYGGIFHSHYGHFLVEALQRLWYTKGCKLPIVWSGGLGYFFSGSKLSPWQNDIFQKLNIQNEHIFLTEPTQFSKVHFPEPGMSINTHLHPEHAAFLGAFENTPIEGKYVYFSRSKIRGCANEEQLEELLKKRGWSIVYPETMTVAQQLKAMSTAQVCFMVGGSAQHSMLLAKNLKTRFIVIPREHGNTFNYIANCKSDNYYLLHLPKKVLYSDLNTEANDFFTLDLELINKYLNETADFTKDLESPTFTRPEKLTEKQLNVPDWYYAPLPKPSYAQKLFYHAHFLYEQKKYALAYKIFMHLRKKNLLETHMYYDFFKAVQMYHVQNGTNIYLPLEKQTQHVQKLEEIIKKAPQNNDNYKKLSKYYLIGGEVAKAKALLEELRQRNPHWSYPLTQLANISRMEENIDMAIEYMQQAVTIEPQNLKCKGQLADYLLLKNDYVACKDLLTKALQTNPTWDAGYVQLASVHKKMNALDKAMACIQKAMEINPHNLQAQEQFAEYMHQKGEQAQAINILAKAMQKNPRAGERYAQNARIYEMMGDMDKTIENARLAVEMEPRNFVCKAHLATYLRKNKKYAELTEFLQELMHLNPFWSEPHAQFAAMYDTEGELDKAIDYARKAIAVEPYDPKRKAEVFNYREKKMSTQFYSQSGKLFLSSTWGRIQNYLDILYAKTYLEIGVEKGNTFLYLDVPFKIGVDPAFQFDTTLYANENVHLYAEPSDEFFDKFPERAKELQDVYHDKPFKFDVIFIDGLHTFEQTLRDFENSLAYGHEKTIWVIDDTVPSNCFSALDSQEKCIRYKECAKMSMDEAWHGDVFKVIFYIHDNYQEFSYCTQVNFGNPQTILWRTEKPTQREKFFESTESIAKMRYEDFLEHAWVMHLVEDAEVVGNFFTNIDPLDYKTDEEYKQVLVRIVTDREINYKFECIEYKTIADKLMENQELFKQDLEKEIQKNNKLTEQNAVLEAENKALKNHLKSIGEMG